MPAKVEVYLEAGKKRVFARAVEWPGLCRSGRSEEAALQALIDYAPRYRAALGRAAQGFTLPETPASFRVVERLAGNATTDFGAPAIAPASDERPLDEGELKREQRLLRACWAAFDRAADAASSAVLRKGPRGGGRDLDAIVAHVSEAERAYLSLIGGLSPKRAGSDALRKAIVDEVASRARGEPPANPRRSGRLWSPRYFVRRTAWHALDHAWEIEDRAVPASA